MSPRGQSTALLLASLAVIGAFGAAPMPASAASTHQRPVLKNLIYTPLTEHGSDGFLEARFTVSFRLYKPAPSIAFTIDSVGTHNVETEAGPSKSYGVGLHHATFTTDAFSGGTYRVTLVARVRPPAGSGRSFTLLKSTDPATLVIAAAPEGVAGAGTVTKI
jgi:hypothetical protein